MGKERGSMVNKGGVLVLALVCTVKEGGSSDKTKGDGPNRKARGGKQGDNPGNLPPLPVARCSSPGPQQTQA